MPARCDNCGHVISTWQELSTVGAEAVRAVFDAIKGDLGPILHEGLRLLNRGIQAFLGVFGSISIAGFVAGPLNTQGAKCPHCGAAERWVEEP